MMREADMNEKPYGIEIAPTGGDPVFAQRETGVTHTPYETEKVFYSCIRAGDAEGVKKFFGDYLAQGIVVGRMSADPLTQMKYFAVCCVTLACRYAILGGLEESEAFNFSDECIRRVDAMKDGEEIMSFLMRRACDLAERVGGAGTAADVPPPVRKCLNRISRNLHGKSPCPSLLRIADCRGTIFPCCSGRASGAAYRAMLRGGSWKRQRRCFRKDIRWGRWHICSVFPPRAIS